MMQISMFLCLKVNIKFIVSRLIIINFFELLFKWISGSIRGSAQTAILYRYLTNH